MVVPVAVDPMTTGVASTHSSLPGGAGGVKGEGVGAGDDAVKESPNSPLPVAKP